MEVIVIVVIVIYLFLINQGVGLNKDCFQKCFGITDSSLPQCTK